MAVHGTSDHADGVLLGVGRGGHLSDGTVAFAVSTAKQMGVGIELVHVVPPLVDPGARAWAARPALDRALELQLTSRRDALDEALRRVREQAKGTVPVSGQLVHGEVVPTLVELSTTVQLVVLMHRALSRRDRAGSGSVTQAVAARAHAPVVCVPAGWQPPETSLPITVAVEDAARAPAEVWTALGFAALSDLPVVFLRAAYLAAPLEELLLHKPRHDDLLAGARLELERDVELPDCVADTVPCTFEARWGHPADVLVSATAESSLLVMAKRDPLLPIGSHLGSVVRHVLTEATCPVMVVEPSSVRSASLRSRPHAS